MMDLAAQIGRDVEAAREYLSRQRAAAPAGEAS